MGLSIVDVLEAQDRIDEDDLARRFAERGRAQPDRGYGEGAHQLLTAIAEGQPWRAKARSLFRGVGSFGNGAAMRVAPIGAYFAGDLERVKSEAILSAEV